jgi:hypothetical protein
MTQFTDVESLILQGRFESAKATVTEICGSDRLLAWAKKLYLEEISKKEFEASIGDAYKYKKPKELREVEARKQWAALFKDVETI